MIKLRLLIHIIFTNIVGNAVVHMDISLTVDGQPVRIRQKLCPQFLITAEFPVVAVEAAPENGATVSVKELFGSTFIRAKSSPTFILQECMLHHTSHSQ